MKVPRVPAIDGHACLGRTPPIDDRTAILHGEASLVRRFSHPDAVPFHGYRNDPATARHQGWDIPYPPERAEAFIEWASTAPLMNPDSWCQLAIESRRTCALIGDVGIHTLDDAGTVEVGVTLSPGARGQGLATEAIHIVLAHLTQHHGVHRAIAWIADENQPSRNLFERLGFVHAATERTEGGETEHRYELNTAPEPGPHGTRQATYWLGAAG